MLTIKDIFNLYEKYNVSASKRFGQNFLVDHNVLKKIISASDIENKDVIEIGPGLGSLTIPLLEVASSVTSYEIDDDMINVLNGEIQNPKFTLRHEDFLSSQFDWQGKKTLVANIPYNITSDIIFKLLENISFFDKAIIMIQKEVAERILAKINQAEYSKLTVTLNHFANIEKVIVVKPSSFIPAPKVDSMVIKLEFKDLQWQQEKPFVNFIKQCFAQRRKTLFNNLKNIYDVESIKSTFVNLKLKENIRSQELNLDEFISIFKHLSSAK